MDEADNIQTLTHATERDIDLLVVEELRCNPAFTRLFVSAVGNKANTKLKYVSMNVLHSKRRLYNRREIDICLELVSSDHDKSYLLIENKLDTSEQEQQAESYRDECQLLRAEDKATAALAVLICTMKYAADNTQFSSKFDAIVSYEALANMLEECIKLTKHDELTARLAYRAELIRQAITKQRRGYEAVIRPELGEFNSKYVKLCRSKFPSLVPGSSMLKQGNPSESKTMIFDAKTLHTADFLPQIRIVHQLREGDANIHFYVWGNYFEAIAPGIRQDLKDTPFKVGATFNRRKGGNSGLTIYQEVTKINNFSDFQSQQDAILEGMCAVEALRVWFNSNLPVLRKWANLIAQQENGKAQ